MFLVETLYLTILLGHSAKLFQSHRSGESVCWTVPSPSWAKHGQHFVLETILDFLFLLIDEEIIEQDSKSKSVAEEFGTIDANAAIRVVSVQVRYGRRWTILLACIHR